MGKMTPPPTGIKVRMYRQGHGDCFLLAARKTNDDPFFILIDCGLWSGSEVAPNTLRAIVADIGKATGNHLDVVLITHEHEDHVVGFGITDPGTGRKTWDPIAVEEVWLAWTEDGTDPDANALRKRFNDVLFGLLGAVRAFGRVGVAATDERLKMITELAGLHTGEANISQLAADNAPAPGLGAAGAALAANPAGYSNKTAMKYIRDKSGGRVRFLSPGAGPYTFAGVDGIRVFALGPPREEKLLLSLNPHSDEEFKFRLDGASAALLGALSDGVESRAGNPFSPRYGKDVDELARLRGAGVNSPEQQSWIDFFRDHHGFKGLATGGPQWRRIDSDWLDATEALALRLNDEVNNTSLVIAIELPATRKVLVFSGDAQRGNWISWSGLKWQPDGAEETTTRDLLSRAVFYKVGHHGSHNATLNGTAQDEFANLGWFGLGDAASEFVAMIPANKDWAFAKKPHPWKHPLKAIEDELLAKAAGRVFRTDQSGIPTRPGGVSAADWKWFADRSVATQLYFEYEIPDGKTQAPPKKAKAAAKPRRRRSSSPRGASRRPG